MAKDQVTVKGLSEVAAAFEALASSKVYEEVATDVLKEGGGIAADYMRSQLNKLHTTDENYRSDKRYASKKEKELLLKEMGVTPVKSKGDNINIKVGFDGYGYPTKAHPDGVPTALIANSINRGTSFLIPQPFINRTMSAGKKEVIAAMQKKFEDETVKIFNQKTKS